MEFVSYFKLAVAVAIIRNKPSGQSAEEYAASLADQYHQEQQSLRDKIQSLEEQVLFLKQQQFLQEQQQVSTDPTGGQFFKFCISKFTLPMCFCFLFLVKKTYSQKCLMTLLCPTVRLHADCMYIGVQIICIIHR